MNPKERYQKGKDRYGRLAGKQAGIINRLSNLRLLVFGAGAGLGVFFWMMKLYFLSAASIAGMLLLFLYLVVQHLRVIENHKYAILLKELNEAGISRLEGEWKNFADTGSEFIQEEHRYSGDLDLFGEGSLFQWMCTAVTPFGRQRLQEYLSHTPSSVEDIRSRQQSAAELGKKLYWRQRLQAAGMLIKGEIQEPSGLFEWAAKRHPFYTKGWVRLGLWGLPVLTVLLGLLYLAFDRVPWYLPLGFVLVQGILLLPGRKKRAETLQAVEKFKDSVRVYRTMMQHIEKQSFNSSRLKELQKALRGSGGQRAFHQIDRLVKITDMITSRYNLFYVFLNLLTLWDYHCLRALEDWKADSGRLLGKWLEGIGEMEALCSLGAVCHDHPHWTTPEILEQEPALEAAAMGHPLIGEKGRVNNDLAVMKPAGILLITGSNMSGKSTLLRTAGINLVLAYAGAPVCAEGFRCSVLELYTCMRVSDNLEKNISSFYAELQRIKSIVQACESGKKVFFLLDEIFKGTNSADRHTGAKVLVRKLLERGALGLVSTHDLELGDLEQESGGSVRNFHFREYYDREGIRFDYKLRPGVSTTRNARYLMRMAGIEIE